MTWVEWYQAELEAVRQRPDGAVYARGLQRGFEGEPAVPEDEHQRLITDPDAGSTYREGLLEGMNLRVWSTWYGAPE